MFRENGYYNPTKQISDIQRNFCLRLIMISLKGARLHPTIHLKIMQEMQSHLIDCNFDKKIAISSVGKRGDLFFILRCYESYIIQSY